MRSPRLSRNRRPGPDRRQRDVRGGRLRPLARGARRAARHRRARSSSAASVTMSGANSTSSTSSFTARSAPEPFGQVVLEGMAAGAPGDRHRGRGARGADHERRRRDPDAARRCRCARGGSHPSAWASRRSVRARRSRAAREAWSSPPSGRRQGCSPSTATCSPELAASGARRSESITLARAPGIAPPSRRTGSANGRTPARGRRRRPELGARRLADVPRATG